MFLLIVFSLALIDILQIYSKELPDYYPKYSHYNKFYLNFFYKKLYLHAVNVMTQKRYCLQHTVKDAKEYPFLYNRRQLYSNPYLIPEVYFTSLNPRKPDLIHRNFIKMAL
jgi:hypothetical protein